MSGTPKLDHRIASAEGQAQAAERMRDKAERKAARLADELAKVRADTLEEAAKLVESCIGCITEPLQECAKDGDEAAQFFGKMHAAQIRALAAPTAGPTQ